MQVIMLYVDGARIAGTAVTIRISPSGAGEVYAACHEAAAQVSESVCYIDTEIIGETNNTSLTADL